MVERYSGNSWAIGLRSAAAILLGFLAFVLPGPTLAGIVMLFGVYALTDGVLAVVAAVRGVRRHERWGAMLFEGIVGIAAGLIVLLIPGVGALALAYVVAAWALMTGALEIAAAIRLRKIITGEWLLLLTGIISIAFAVVVAFRPAAGALALVWWLGAYALAFGVVTLVLAVRVKQWSRANA